MRRENYHKWLVIKVWRGAVVTNVRLLSRRVSERVLETPADYSSETKYLHTNIRCSPAHKKFFRSSLILLENGTNVSSDFFLKVIVRRK
jgi:hypothetical protein